MYNPTNAQEAEHILDKYCLFNNVVDIQLDSQGRVDIWGDVDMQRLPPDQKFPLRFGKIIGYFVARDVGLTTLEGAPHTVTGVCNLASNQLTDLTHGPTQVGDIYTVNHNPLTSLVGFPDQGCKVISLIWNPHLPLLRCLMAKEVWLSTLLRFDHEAEENANKVADILNKHAGEGKRMMLNCALELKQAGFEDNAKW